MAHTVPSRSRVLVVGHRPCSSHIFHTSFRSERLARVSPPPTLVSVWGSHRRQEAQPHSSTQGVTPLQSQFSPLPPRTFTQVSPPAEPTPTPFTPPCTRVFLCVNRAQWPCDLSTNHSQDVNRSFYGLPSPTPIPQRFGHDARAECDVERCPHHDDVGHPHPYSLPRVARRCHVKATVDSSFLVVLCIAIPRLRRILLWRRRARLQREKTTIHMHACM